MNFNAPNYKEHLKEYFNQKLFFQERYFSIFYMKVILVRKLLYEIYDSISIYFLINFEKSLGRASSFT